MQQQGKPPIKRRGFGSSGKASAAGKKGATTAHQRGTAHEWDKDEASDAGKKSGVKRKREELK